MEVVITEAMMELFSLQILLQSSPSKNVCGVSWLVYPGFVRSLHKKMKFYIKDFFSKYEQIRRKLLIWSHLLKKPLMENFVFCATSLYFEVPLS